MPANVFFKERGHRSTKCTGTKRVLPPVGQSWHQLSEIVKKKKEENKLKISLPILPVCNFVSLICRVFIKATWARDYQTVCMCVCVSHFLPIAELICGLQRIGVEEWKNGKRRRRREKEAESQAAE